MHHPQTNNRTLLFAGLLFAAAWLPATNATAQPAKMIWPGPDVQERLQAALIQAKPGDTVHLGQGRFELTDGLSLSVDSVTIKGRGQNRTRLIFAQQQTAGEGLLVTANNVSLQDFSVEDTRADGIKAQGCSNIKMQRLRVEWTRGPHPDNGAYGLYPVQCSGVLIEDSTVIGASDAGIYVGQSQQIIVRNNKATHNVAGLEIENSYYADVYGNLTEHNTGGIMIFDLPNLPQQGGHHIRVFNNRSHTNDTPNFATPGTTVADVPLGIGLMVMANRDVEIFGNHLSNNATTNLLVVSYLEDFDDDNYNRYPKNVYIHGNHFANGGFDPDKEKAGILLDILETPVPDIVWDGVVPLTDRLLGGAPAVVLGQGNDRADGTAATFADLDLIPWATPVWNWFHSPIRDPAAYAGGLDSLPEVRLEF